MVEAAGGIGHSLPETVREVLLKRLYLLRHAKSSWANEGLSDFDRPLNRRGRRAAALMGEFMDRNGHHPQLILSSPSARTRETLSILERHASWTHDAQFEDDLYGASSFVMLNRLRGLPDTAAAVMLLGHNPGLESMAHMMIGDGAPDALSRLQAKYPTAALSVISFGAGTWRDAGPGAGTLEAFVRPADLERD